MISPKGDTHTTRAAHSSSVVASSNTTQFEELKQYMQKYSPEDNISDSLLSGFLINKNQNYHSIIIMMIII
jgi:hypothetical protein